MRATTISKYKYLIFLMDYEVFTSNKLSKEIYRQRFEKVIGENFDFYMKKLHELAEGVWIYYKTPDGTITKAYKRSPDPKILLYIHQQLMGDVPEHKNDSQSQGIITISNMLKSLANEKRTRLQLNEGGSGLDVSERSRDSVYTDADTRENS